MMKKLLFILLFLMPTYAFAQTCIGTPPLTQTTVDNTINVCLPTNNANEISALALRQTLQTMTAATFQNGNPAISVLSFGAKCDGTTDDTVAINAALASGSVNAIIPNATCFSLTGITVPPGSSLSGLSWIGGIDPTLFTGGSRILCPVNIPNPCIEVGVNNGASNTGSVSNLIVQGSGSATLTQGIGIRVDGIFNVSLNQVMVFNFYQGYYWKSYNTAGLGGKMWQAYSGRIKDAHIVVDSWPELQISQSRFGVNGTSDIGANAYLRFSSVAHANPAAAANTFDCVECQFNEGNGSAHVNNWVEFVNFPSGFPTDDAEIFRFTNSHAENVNYGIYTDSSWNVLYDFRVTSSSFAFLTDAFSQINAATVLKSFTWTAANINAGTVTLNLASGSDATFVGGWFQQAAIFNTPSGGSRINLTGANFQGGYTINGTSWLSVNLVGNVFASKSISLNTQLSSPIVDMDAGDPRTIFASTSPTLTMTDLGSSSNSKNWDFFSQSGTFYLRAVNDAYNVSSNAISCTRSTSTVTGCTIGPSLSTNTVISNGAKPTLTGTCVVVGGTQVGGNTVGSFAIPAGNCAAATTIILAFAVTAPNGYACDAHNQNTPTSILDQTANSVTSATLTIRTVTSNAADVVVFKCMSF